VEAEVKANYPESNIRLVKGGGGIFEVKCDGKLIYSKKNTHRFPNEGEVARLIKQEKD
jgi:selenoprotein W-related protein